MGINRLQRKRLKRMEDLNMEEMKALYNDVHKIVNFAEEYKANIIDQQPILILIYTPIEEYRRLKSSVKQVGIGTYAEYQVHLHRTYDQGFAELIFTPTLKKIFYKNNKDLSWLPTAHKCIVNMTIFKEAHRYLKEIANTTEMKAKYNIHNELFISW